MKVGPVKKDTLYKIISKRHPNQPSMTLSRSFQAVTYFSSALQKGLDVSHLFIGVTKPLQLSHTHCKSKSSDTSIKPPHYLAVKLAGGKVIYCEVKPLLDHEEEFSKKLEKGWCVMCDLKPLEQKGKGKLIGAVAWDGERLKSSLMEHLDLGTAKFLQ